VIRGGVAADVRRARGDSGQGAWHAGARRAQREPRKAAAAATRAHATREASWAVLHLATISTLLLYFSVSI